MANNDETEKYNEAVTEGVFTPDEVRAVQGLDESTDDVVAIKPKRRTKKEETVEVTFQVLRPFTWHGTRFEPGEHTLNAEEYGAMMVDLSARTDRVVFVLPDQLVEVDWTSRRRETDRGYVKVWCPEHPCNFSGWVYEHRLVAEQKLGRFLRPGETVHHICEKDDNRPEALIVCERKEHVRLHK